MHRESYYLIRPKADLVARVKVEYDLSESVTEEVLFSPRLLSKTTVNSVGSDVTHIMQVKLMFLVDVLVEYDEMEDPIFRDVVENELGADSYSVATFDKLWTIEYMGTSIEPYNSYEDEATAEILQKFSKTGDSIIDDWIARLLKGN